MSSSCLLSCPPLLQTIESVCEELILADIAPPISNHNMVANSAISHPGLQRMSPPPGLGFRSSAGMGEMVMPPPGFISINAKSTENSALQFVSQLVVNPPPTHWQLAAATPPLTSTCSVLLPYDPKGVWPKVSVVAINEMLMSSTLCGRVLREPGQTPLFYPLDPSGTGMFLSDVLSERGYSVRESLNKQMVSTSPVQSTSPGATHRSPYALPAIVSPSKPPCPPAPVQAVCFKQKIFPINYHAACRVSAVETGPWKFSIQFISQTSVLNNMRSLINVLPQNIKYPVHYLQVTAHNFDNSLFVS